MNLEQLDGLRNWHLRHGQTRRVERHAWESVLTLWLLGWSGIPAALLSSSAWMPLACLALIASPSAYVALRARLHRRGHLRCDWLILLR